MKMRVYAHVMELADMRDLGSRVERRAGSSPVMSTIKETIGVTPLNTI